MSNGTFMLYGATGYTGRLTAKLAKARGLTPILAGRSADAVAALGRELDLSTRVFSLDDARATRAALDGVDVVLHAAGPFSATSRPMVDACLAAKVSYLDITGEIAVFEAIFARDAEARAAGVSLVPGVGFDVVPTDCVAALLKAELPDATELELAFAGLGSMSRGTLKTSLEGLPSAGRIRKDGALVRVPHAYRVKTIAFPHGERLVVSIPWGDVATAYRSTGIPDIVVYMGASPGMVRQMKLLRVVAPLLGVPALQRFLQRRLERRAAGPSDERRARGYSDVWGQVRNAAGQTASMALTTPEGYTLTADSSLRAVLRVLAGDVAPGALTPSQAFGSRFVLECEGVVVAGG
ncbi:MAG: saccharopine dehydrogenase NADP-binding domain-containing protein [Polyangiaceae bacterium]|nr:saccharopine dehydrogenase NADP-binding domain-containing protein [Polyangiaceae bacterium]